MLVHGVGVFRLVSRDRRPASAVANQYHFLKSSRFGEVNPRANISYLVAGGDTPITAAPNSFVTTVTLDVSKVVDGEHFK